MQNELPVIHDRADAIETWLRTEVVAAYDALRAGSAQAISSDALRIHLADLHRQQLVERDS